MKHSLVFVTMVIVLALLLSASGAIAQEPGTPSSQAALGTAFTYQGQLKNASGPINDICDFQFGLWDAGSNGAQLGTTQTKTGVAVSAGYFTVQLDFGASVFAGDARWLAIAVRCPAGSGAYAPLSPRQLLAPTPYALFSSSTGALWGRSVAMAAPSADQVLKWNGSAWTPITDTAHMHWGQTWQGAEFGLTLVVTQTSSSNSTALHANASGNGNGTGIQGIVSPSGSDAWMLVPTGVSGISLAPAGGWDNRTYGVFGQASGWGGFGVYGYGSYTGTAGIASADWGIGVYGEAKSAGGTGVYGNGDSYGVYGVGPYGIYGSSPMTNGTGIAGVANTGDYAYGVWGISSSGYAGYFNGNVYVSGNLSASGAKSFKIDNPLDPENQYLYHYAVESPRVQNMYNGTVTLDAQGAATVQLPDYFSALNAGDYCYSLTAIGAPMPNLYIAEEIQGNTFRIAGGVAGEKVSWVVYGQRNDPWLRDHPQPDLAAKPEDEIGTYLYPQGYGQPESLAPDYVHMQQLQSHAAITATTSFSMPTSSPWVHVQPVPDGPREVAP